MNIHSYRLVYLYPHVHLCICVRSVRTLKRNENCTINFSSFELNNKKVDYVQWHDKRTDKIIQKAEKQGQVCILMYIYYICICIYLYLCIPICRYAYMYSDMHFMHNGMISVLIKYYKKLRNKKREGGGVKIYMMYMNIYI
jgi:hypothetical protein